MTLAELRALCDAATPGPWRYDEHQPEWNGDASYSVVVPHLGEQMLLDDTRYYPTAPAERADARFIAAARTAMPLLLAVAEAATKIYPGQLQSLDDALAALEAAP